MQDMGHCVRSLASLHHRLWVGLADGRIRLLAEKAGGAPANVQVGLPVCPHAPTKRCKHVFQDMILAVFVL